MREGNIGSMLTYFAGKECGLPGYEESAKEELESGGRIRFMLIPHGYGDIITHWHLIHKKSGTTFIVKP